jgi:hypothetical protein
MAALRAACAQIRGYRVPGPCPGPECRFIVGIRPQGTPGNSAKRRESADGETVKAIFNHPPWGFRIRPELCQGLASTTTGHVSLPHVSGTAAGGGSTAKRTALTPLPLGFQQAVDEHTSAACGEATSASGPEPNPPVSYTGPGLGQDSGLGSATCGKSIPQAPPIEPVADALSVRTPSAAGGHTVFDDDEQEEADLQVELIKAKLRASTVKKKKREEEQRSATPALSSLRASTDNERVFSGSALWDSTGVPHLPGSVMHDWLLAHKDTGAADEDSGVEEIALGNAPSPDFTALGDVLEESFWDDATNNMAMLHPAPTDTVDTVGEMPGGGDEVPEIPSQFDWLP